MTVARQSSLEAAFFTAALIMRSGSAESLNAQRAAFADMLMPRPAIDYRAEAEAAGLHPPKE